MPCRLPPRSNFNRWGLLLFLTAISAWQPRTCSVSQLSTRRQWLGDVPVAAGMAVVASCGRPSVAFSVVAAEDVAPLVDENRPYAPSVTALVPATEQRLLLRYALRLAMQTTTTSMTTEDKNRWEALRQVVVVDEDDNDKNASTRRAVLGQANQAFFQPPSSASQPTTTSTSLALSGRRVRRSCNYYTAQLRFADSYLLTGNAADRKQWIRQNNGLPNVKQVIVADLDLRDLYRNAVQDALQDTAAELERDEPDAAEVVELLQSAETNLNQWFALIRPADVEAALAVVMEGQQQKSPQ